MKADKVKATKLLKTAKGQIEGIMKMVEEDRYCMDISNQLLATQAILHKLNKEILTEHIKGCVSDTIGDNNEDGNAKIDEIIKIIDKLAK